MFFQFTKLSIHALNNNRLEETRKEVLIPAEAITSVVEETQTTSHLHIKPEWRERLIEHMANHHKQQGIILAGESIFQLRIKNDGLWKAVAAAQTPETPARPSSAPAPTLAP